MASTSAPLFSTSTKAKVAATDVNTLAATTQPMIDHNHPLFLYPSETPNLSPISENLTGSDTYAF